MQSSCLCMCGNVQIKGQMVLQNMHQCINSYDRKNTQNCKSLFLILSHPIEIQNLTNCKGSLHSESCDYTRCTKCGTVFRFFSCNKKSYVEKIIQSKPPQRQSNKSKICLSQKNNHIQNLNHYSDSGSTEYNEEDIDFELMFSNKYDPFIGSSKNRVNVSIDGLLENVSY